MDYEALLEPMRGLFYFLSSFDFCLLCTIKAEYNNSRNLKEPTELVKQCAHLQIFSSIVVSITKHGTALDKPNTEVKK